MFFKKQNLLLVFVFTTLIIAGCSSRGKLDEIGAPTWVFDPSSLAKTPDEISAVGIGEATQGGLKVQLAQAEADARGGIANQILSELTRISKDAVRKTKVASSEDVEKIFSQATQEVVRDLPLSGAIRTNIWQDPKTDILYVRMILDGKRIAGHLNTSMQIYEKRLQQSGLTGGSTQDKDLISTFNQGVNNRFKDDLSSEESNNLVPKSK